ncbi:restriction endonuclease subunit S [Salinimicrobium sediminilitoris]|uniref:restriction endonuclease subunit S n=1 Tax=Salinimicrobium sediminilitoris TaxID=2876715 RepID=UPI001E32C9E2|nr:restriction endonuclease subunit S [Salinimicrobium sediminilitoris]MCC8360259.1 restriction endonuclease subunit S [Salinimicrobium sediminilitoris]
MKVLKIGEIVDVQFGPHLKASSKGAIKYLLAGHFDENFQPTNFSESLVNSSDRTKRFELKPNDVILAGKGHRIFAWAYNEKYGPMVPSSLFYLLRVTKEVIIGEYLAAVLNSEKLQHSLELIGAGVTINSIPKKELKEIELHIPSIKEQKKFLEIYALLEKNIELTHQLLQEKRNLKRGVVNELLTNKNES